MSYSNAVALRMPSSYVTMSNEEMEYLEGGGTVTLHLGVSCTVGGLVTGLMSGVIAGAITALTGGLGGVLGWAAAQIVSDLLSSSLNKYLPNNGGWYSKTLNLSVTKACLPNWTGTYYLDIAGLAGQGGGRNIGGGLANSAKVLLNGRQVAVAGA